MSAVERVVGVGSSAGGLDALTDALSSVGADVPFAFIVAQHMAADYDSPLVGLLQPVTSLRVREARDGAALEPGVVEVCPPDRNIVVEGCVRLTRPDGPGAPPECGSAALLPG
jgi:chemotaxis response regulator CheB